MINQKSNPEYNPNAISVNQFVPRSYPILLLWLAWLICSNSYGQLPFTDGFNTGAFNPTFWELNPGVNGIIDLHTDADRTNSDFGVRMGKSFDDGAFTTNALDLHLNLSGYSQVELDFWIRDIADETQVFDGLYFSDNGGLTFTPLPVMPFKPADWCDGWGRFPPIDVDQLAQKHGLQLTAQFVIRFQQHDDGDFSGGGSASPDGFYIDDVHVYVPQVAYAPIRPGMDFFDSFETGKFGPNWAWRFADSTARLVPFPTKPSNAVGVLSGIGYDSPYGVLMGKACDDGFSTNALDLQLDLEGQSQVELSFRIQDIADETHIDDGLWFSDNGGLSFKEVYRFRPEDWCNAWGQFPPFDVDQLAEKHGLSLTKNFIIRFQQHDDGDFSGGGSASPDGFFIDDVHVYIPETAYAPVRPGLDFCDGFETGNLGPNWAWRFADSTARLVPHPTKPTNYVGVLSNFGYDSPYGVAMGKLCDDGFSTNALDLHLNLEGQSQVELSFRIQDIADETQFDDGLWFSDNGGLDFKEVYRFRPEDWCNAWGQFPPFDVDQLAKKYGLNLTKNFIIRFQQHDDGDFSGGGSVAPDGFALDDVCVYVPNLVYADIPFCDDFETGAWQPAWAWRFADSTSVLASVPTRPSNFAGVVSGIGYNSPYGVAMGKSCDDGFAANALDLHLNLENKSNVLLSFRLAHIAEETHSDDAIYFSDNGGLDFKKAYTFNYANLPSGVYLDPEFNIDVVALANAAGVNLTKQFVIRFQQHDDGDFSGGGSVAPDGIYLDNVCVTGVTPVKNEAADQAVSVFPNPVRETLYIQLPFNPGETGAYRLTDLSGRLVAAGNCSGATAAIPMAGLPAGFFLLELHRNGWPVARQKVYKL